MNSLYNQLVTMATLLGNYIHICLI